MKNHCNKSITLLMSDIPVINVITIKRPNITENTTVINLLISFELILCQSIKLLDKIYQISINSLSFEELI